MDSTQVVNYVFIVGGLLIVSALVLYCFFPKLRINSFKLEGSVDILNLPKPQEKYCNEIASGEVIFVKGKLNLSNKLVLYLLVFGFILILFYLYFVLNKLYNLIHECWLNESFSLSLILHQGFDLAVLWFPMSIYLIQKHLRKLYVGTKTGYTDNPNKSYLFDKVIKKYNHIHRKSDIGYTLSFTITFIFIIIYTPNWSIIRESTNFSEANKLAYEQCLSQKKKS